METFIKACRQLAIAAIILCLLFDYPNYASAALGGRMGGKASAIVPHSAPCSGPPIGTAIIIVGCTVVLLGGFIYLCHKLDSATSNGNGHRRPDTTNRNNNGGDQGTSSGNNSVRRRKTTNKSNNVEDQGTTTDNNGGGQDTIHESNNSGGSAIISYAAGSQGTSSQNNNSGGSAIISYDAVSQGTSSQISKGGGSAITTYDDGASGAQGTTNESNNSGGYGTTNEDNTNRNIVTAYNPPPVHHTAVYKTPPPVHHTPTYTVHPPVHHTPVYQAPPPVHHAPTYTVHHTPTYTAPPPVHHTPTYTAPPPPVHHPPTYTAPPPVRYTPTYTIPSPVRITPTYTVIKLQIGLLASGGSLQWDLNRIASSANTSTMSGLHYVLKETINALLRFPHDWVAAYSSVNEITGKFEHVERILDKQCAEERWKFAEGLVNVNGTTKRSSTPMLEGSTSFSNDNGYVVVTILVAATGGHKLPDITYKSDLKNALKKLLNLPSTHSIKEVEVLWTPLNESETLLKRELLKNYRQLRLLC